MPITRAQVDRDAEVSPPTTLWRQYTVTRMLRQGVGMDLTSGAAVPFSDRYEVVKTYNPNGFFHSNKHYARVQQDGSLQLMTEFEARRQYGEDTALHGYVECDAAWSPLH
jgi:hypothetical protein